MADEKKPSSPTPAPSSFDISKLTSNPNGKPGKSEIKSEYTTVSKVPSGKKDK